MIRYPNVKLSPLALSYIVNFHAQEPEFWNELESYCSQRGTSSPVLAYCSEMLLSKLLLVRRVILSVLWYDVFVFASIQVMMAPVGA